MISTNAAIHILVVDDEEQIRTLLANLFTREGYKVSLARNSAETIAVLAEMPVDLITLDLNLGGEDGLVLARELRASRDVPIIMISAKSDEIDRVVGLELGADDYITKPFSLREVLARVRAVLRRYQPVVTDSAMAQSSVRECYSFAGMRLDLAARELFLATGEVIDLTTAEFNLLELLIKRPARVLSRNAIMDLLKGHEWSPYDRTIDTLVGRLRRKIEIDPEQPKLVKTVRGVGYTFTADVVRG
jgi:two-component system, OmpR family, response regulator